MSITIPPNWGATRLQIWKDGAEAGHIEKGEAYAQRMRSADLRELADQMDEYEAKKGKR